MAFIISIIIIIIIKYSKPTEIPWRCLTIVQTWDAHRVPYNIILHLSQAYKNIYWLLKCVFTVLNMWLMNIKASGDEPTWFPFGFLWGECCRCCSNRTGALHEALQEPHDMPEAGGEETRAILRLFPCSSKAPLVINLIILLPQGEKLRGCEFILIP